MNLDGLFVRILVGVPGDGLGGSLLCGEDEDVADLKIGSQNAVTISD
jgi:hypothetical protein